MKLESFSKIVSVFNQHEVNFILVGGLAVVSHGYPRMTVDIKTLIKMKEVAGRPKDLDDIEHLRLLNEGK